MDWPAIIRRCFETDRVLYSGHATREMRYEEFGTITDQELHEAISRSEVIEFYPHDTPYPSVLIFGTTNAGVLFILFVHTMTKRTRSLS